MNICADVDHMFQYVSSYDESARVALEVSSSDVLSMTFSGSEPLKDY